jgi:hypothetical protein
MFKSKIELLRLLELIAAFLDRKNSPEESVYFDILLKQYVANWIKG